MSALAHTIARPQCLGEIAHIEAENEGGPRFNPSMTSEQRNAVDNLILLCPNHHTEIDLDLHRYSVQRLRDLRDNHLQWVDRNLSENIVPWKSNLSQFTYLNVPRLLEFSELQGISVDLTQFRSTHYLHNLRWDLNIVMSRLKAVIDRLQVKALPSTHLLLAEKIVGEIVSLDRVPFYTKNGPKLPLDEHHPQVLTGDLRTDPHIYHKIQGGHRLILTINPEWVTTTTAFVEFNGGRTRQSGFCRIRSVDMESNSISATPLALGFPASQFLDALDRPNAGGSNLTE